MRQLDVKDKKILHLVNRDARLSLSDLSRRLDIPRNVVKNRLLRLEKDKVIKTYKTVINFELLGFQEYEVYLRLTDIDSQKMGEIINSFISNRSVSWVGTCFGNYDIKMSFFAKNNQESYNVLSDALSGFKEHIKAQEIVGITKKYKMDSTLFLNTVLKENFNPFLISGENKAPSWKPDTKKKGPLIDGVDRKIILCLNQNPKARFSELAKEAGLTVQGAKNRFDSLVRKRIILGTKALINGQALGFVWATCLFKLSLNEEQEELLEDYIQNMSGTTSAVRIIGKWDLGITFFSESIKDLQQNINDFKSAFKDSIKDYDCLIILDSHKYPHLPGCVLD